MASYSTSTRTIRITTDGEVEVISRSTPHTVVDTYDLNAENAKFSKGTGDTFVIAGTPDEGNEQLGDTELDGNEVDINTSNEMCNTGSGQCEDLATMDIYAVLNDTTLEFTKDDV